MPPLVQEKTTTLHSGGVIVGYFARLSVATLRCASTPSVDQLRHWIKLMGAVSFTVHDKVLPLKKGFLPGFS